MSWLPTNGLGEGWGVQGLHVPSLKICGSESEPNRMDSKAEHPALDPDSNKIKIINILFHNLLIYSDVADVKSSFKNYVIFPVTQFSMKITPKLMVFKQS